MAPATNVTLWCISKSVKHINNFISVFNEECVKHWWCRDRKLLVPYRAHFDRVSVTASSGKSRRHNLSRPSPLDIIYHPILISVLHHILVLTRHFLRKTRKHRVKMISLSCSLSLPLVQPLGLRLAQQAVDSDEMCEEMCIPVCVSNNALPLETKPLICNLRFHFGLCNNWSTGIQIVIPLVLLTNFPFAAAYNNMLSLQWVKKMLYFIIRNVPLRSINILLFCFRTKSLSNKQTERFQRSKRAEPGGLSWLSFKRVWSVHVWHRKCWLFSVLVHFNALKRAMWENTS